MPAEISTLIEITLAIGGAVVSIMIFIAGVAWKIGRGLSARDAKIGAIVIRQDNHEKTCNERHDKIDARFEEGSKHFARIERSLGRIEGNQEALFHEQGIKPKYSKVEDSD